MKLDENHIYKVFTPDYYKLQRELDYLSRPGVKVPHKTEKIKKIKEKIKEADIDFKKTFKLIKELLSC